MAFNRQNQWNKSLPTPAIINKGPGIVMPRPDCSHMTTLDWHNFLKRWSAELLQDLDVKAKLPADVIASGWLGYPGATEEQIEGAEARLGARFPPSYRAFLKVSNGWRQVTQSIYKLWSTEDVDWFAVRNQGWIDSWRNEDDIVRGSV